MRTASDTSAGPVERLQLLQRLGGGHAHVLHLRQRLLGQHRAHRLAYRFRPPLAPVEELLGAAERAPEHGGRPPLLRAIGRRCDCSSPGRRARARWAGPRPRRPCSGRPPSCGPPPAAGRPSARSRRAAAGRSRTAWPPPWSRRGSGPGGPPPSSRSVSYSAHLHPGVEAVRVHVLRGGHEHHVRPLRLQQAQVALGVAGIAPVVLLRARTGWD